MSAHACQSKQRGGARRDKASGHLLVQFPRDAGDKRAAAVHTHTHGRTNLHTYEHKTLKHQTGVWCDTSSPVHIYTGVQVLSGKKKGVRMRS